MHQSSFDKMLAFRNNYLHGRENEQLTILDLGSQDVNGAYKKIFEGLHWKYIGVDIGAGRNVDIILKDMYKWEEFSSDSVDVIISGQAFEHIEFFWLTMREISRILKPSGVCCIIAPSSGTEHRHPVDCWRFYSDGFKALAKWAGLSVIFVETQWENLGYKDGSDSWKDSVLIAQKPKASSWFHRIIAAFKRTLSVR